jgi:hypothetical protein
MLRLFVIAWFLFAFTPVSAGDKDSTNTRQSKELGLSISGLYSLVQMDANPYFIGDNTGIPQLENTPGFSAGFHYNFYPGRSLMLRPGVEGVFLPVKIAYQTEINYVTRQRIYPTTVEFPLTLIYSGYRMDAFPPAQAKPEFGLGLRPVITLRPFNDAQPVLKERNLNIDAVIGYPFPFNKSLMRLELFYSYGLFNIIGEDDDYKTRNITSLYRHMAGLRVIFH